MINEEVINKKRFFSSLDKLAPRDSDRNIQHKLLYIKFKLLSNWQMCFIVLIF